MLDKMKEVIQSQDMCVLATVSGDKPHCSLMAYVTDKDCRSIYLITHKDTSKYLNIVENPSVCMLIDTRLIHRGEERHSAKALTVNGVAESIVESTERVSFYTDFLERHRHMKDFASHPNAEVLAVRIKSLQLLDGVSTAYFEAVE
jgi:general stress protein 26